MINVNVVKECVKKYKVSSNGRVVDKTTNEEILDETLKEIIMTSFLVYSKAHHLHDLAKHQRQGKLNLPPNTDEKEYFIEKALDRYGINGKANDFRENKLFQALINGNNKQTTTSLTDSLAGTEYEIFEGTNKKYGLAALKYIARINGKDFSDVNVSIDLSEHKQNGISHITTETTSTQFKPNQDNLSKQQIDAMDDSLKVVYLETKANEYRIIGDETMANYYMSNIKMIKDNDIEPVQTGFSEQTQTLLNDIDQTLNQNQNTTEATDTLMEEENMQQTIIGLLQNEKTPETIMALCELTGVPKEEAERQIDYYQTTEKYELELSKSGLDATMQTSQKWEVINTLTKYAGMEELPPELLQDMNQRTVIDLLQNNKTPETIMALCELTGVPKEEAERQIDMYQTSARYELELSKSGLDATMQTNQKWEVINTLTKYAGMEELPLELLQDMNQRTIIDLLQDNKTPETILHLSELTGLSNEEIEKQIDMYQTSEKYGLELALSGLDATMQTNQKWEVINDLTQSAMSQTNSHTR